ncbi:MAG TPA: 16S rRNA (uracil(1498)-N(3))-methyltransferase [Clostridia bacterium]|nr:16S rRNA (uracil(1498)-N(3))-methyltransferase [Clostridia bacterium]
MSRFFINKSTVDLKNDSITISGEDVKHIGGVLRAVPGDPLELSDGSGTDYDVVIEQLTKDTILTRITGSRQNTTEPPVDVTLFQGIPKADKMDYIIQKCIELGVRRIAPVMTARTVVKFANKKDADSKVTRWRRIALEAAKQCDRGIVPEVCDPIGFEEAVKQAAGYDLKLLPYEEESRGSLRRQLKDFSGVGPGMSEGREEGNSNRKSIAVFIGPEGGFSPAEVQKGVQGGLASVTLGPRILRTETAGLAVTAIIMYELGDMGVDSHD